MKKLSGKTALVTGASRGIGKATAIFFAKNGANLVILARTVAELNETARLCSSHGAEVNAEPLDLADLSQIDTLFSKLASANIHIDILINNAATFHKGPIDSIPREQFLNSLAVNLIAPFYLAQKCLPAMIARKSGAMVNISSLSGTHGTEKFANFGAYNISKYGLWGLTEILALENKSRGIRVNQLSLAGVDTDMFRLAAPPGLKAAMTPEEVAEKILFFASDDSAPRTGENIIFGNRIKEEKTA